MNRDKFEELFNSLSECKFAEPEVPECLEQDVPEVYQALKDNSLLEPKELGKLRTYDSENLGSTKEKPFVITQEEGDYVGVEYKLLDYIFTFVRIDFCGYRVMSQRLECHEGKFYDILTVAVLNVEDKIVEEEYWFDITAGFTALRKKFQK